MKYIFLITLLLVAGIATKAQTGAPSQNINGWIKNTYTVPDSGTVVSKRDTSWIPTKVGMTVTWFNSGVDTVQWVWTGANWKRSGASTIGLGNNISNASLTANGNYVQNWNHHQLKIDSINLVDFNGRGTDGNYSPLKSTFKFAWTPNFHSGGITLSTSLRNSTNSSDSITRGVFINDQSTLISTFANPHYSYVQLNEESNTPTARLEVTENLFSSSLLNGAGIIVKPKYINIYAKDSLKIPGTPSASAGVDSIFAVGAFDPSSGNNIVLKIPKPSGTGTVTSVGLTMPTAFTVTSTTANPITTNGTFNVTANGTSAQYIKGNGVLGTSDTSMIPSFFSKVRSLFSGTSPITYSGTGAFGILNANSSGQKGAATFSNSSFSDDGSGLISLNNVVSSGTCINCQITFSSDGRAASYASGGIPNLVNAPGAGDTLFIVGDTIKRLNAGFGMLHAVTKYNITELVDSNVIATRYWTVRGFYKSCELTGVDTTGATDVSASLQALIDGGCRYIHIPHGKYLFNSTIQLKDSTTIIGDGNSSVILLSSNQIGIKCNWSSGKKSHISDLIIKGTWNGDTTKLNNLQHAIFIDSCLGVTVSNVYFNRIAGFGVYIKHGSQYGPVDNSVYNNFIDSCYGGIKCDTVAEYNVVSGNNITYSFIGILTCGGNNTIVGNKVVWTSYPRMLLGGANNAHCIDVGNVYNHARIAGIYISNTDNGQNFTGDIIRNSVVNEIYMENSDNIWFDNCDIGGNSDSIVSINCTNSNFSYNKYWGFSGTIKTPEFMHWRIVGSAPTITGSGYTPNGVSLYDAVNGKKFDIIHTNNSVDLNTTNVGLLRTNDTLIASVISGGQLANGDIQILSTTANNQGAIKLGTKSAYRDSIDANKNPFLGINQTTYRGYTLDIGMKKGGGIYSNIQNDSICAGCSAIRRLGNGQGHSGYLQLTDATFTTFGQAADCFHIWANGGVGGIRLTATAGDINFGGSVINSTPTYATFKLTSGNLILRPPGTDNGHTLQINGAVTVNKDSASIVTSLTSQYVVVIDTTDNLLKRIQISGLGNTLYTGDGTLLGNRTLGGANKILTLDTLNYFRVNAFSQVFSWPDKTTPYTASIIAGAKNWQLGYTPTALVYSKGAGLYIDTNNNVGVGINIPTTAPLYTAGGSIYLNGAQNQGANFYRVDSITTNVTANLTQYYFRINAANNNVTVTLPAASSAYASPVGIVYIFKRLDNSVNTVTIQASGGNLIDGASSFTLTTQYQSKTIQASSTTAWDVR